jgi:imidazolonepropionase-like amidohydrolase
MLGFVTLLLLCSTLHAAPTALRFGKLIDGNGGVIANAVVVVDGGRIVSVGTAAPAGATLVDLSRYTAIPGMIDVHTHMTYYWDQAPGTRPLGQQRMAAVTVFLAQENARRTLETGVTTVRDLGSSEYMDIAMRELINMGKMIGPRMFVAGYGLGLARTPPRMGAVPPPGGQAKGVAEVVRVVSQQVAAGVDWVKMYGSTGSFQDVTGDQTFNFDEMKAAVDTAHSLGRKIAIHSYGPAGAHDAVFAGADSVEHATDMDDATIAEMVRRGTYYVPTIDHNRFYADNAAKFGFQQAAVDNLHNFIQRNLETAKHAWKAGVKFAMGSDAVYNGFGENTRELSWFVKAGMTPAQALAAATTNPAAMLGQEKNLGAIAPGYFADIVAVEGDPLADISVAIEKVRWVMKGGDVVVDLRQR